MILLKKHLYSTLKFGGKNECSKLCIASTISLRRNLDSKLTTVAMQSAWYCAHWHVWLKDLISSEWHVNWSPDGYGSQNLAHLPYRPDIKGGRKSLTAVVDTADAIEVRYFSTRIWIKSTNTRRKNVTERDEFTTSLVWLRFYGLLIVNTHQRGCYRLSVNK